MIKAAIIFLIKKYQKYLSPDHGYLKFFHPHGYCRFYPTCSQYAIDSIEKYGVVKGVPRAIMRIIRCNPFSRGGYHPVN